MRSTKQQLLQTTGWMTLAILGGNYAPEFINKLLIPLGVGRANAIMSGFRLKDLKTLLGQPEILNHDLQKALIAAGQMAFQRMKKQYISLSDSPDNQKEIDVFFNELINNTASYFLPDLSPLVVNEREEQLHKEELNTFLYESPQKAQTQLLEKLKLPLDALEGSFGSNFCLFFEQELVPQLKWCFGEVLKDPAHEKAWKAFQRLLLEQIQGLTKLTLEEVQTLQYEQKIFRNILDTMLSEINQELKHLDHRLAKVHQLIVNEQHQQVSYRVLSTLLLQNNNTKLDQLLGRVEQLLNSTLPEDLADNLITDDRFWFKSLQQEFKKMRISVGNKPLSVFQHYGWLIEVFLQKMNTASGKKRSLRRLSFMAEAYESSLRYLCYIQLAQLLDNKQALIADIQAFFQLDKATFPKFDFLNLLLKSTALLEHKSCFMPEIRALVAALNDPSQDLYRITRFLEKNRQQLINHQLHFANQEQLEQLLDEYLTALVFWLRKIAFLANYRLVSIKDINLQYRLGSAKNFVHLYGELHGMYSELYGEQDDFVVHSIADYFTYNQSVLLFKGKNVEDCLNKIGDGQSYLSLSPLIIDQSVFSEKNTQTPEIYYYTGKSRRQYHFAQYKNELHYSEQQTLTSNKTLTVQMQNNKQPKLNELFEQLEQFFNPAKTAAL